MTAGSLTTSPPGPTYVVWKLRTMSMKNITSTIESTTSKLTSSDVLFFKATLYGTCNETELIASARIKSGSVLNLPFYRLKMSRIIATTKQAWNNGKSGAKLVLTS